MVETVRGGLSRRPAPAVFCPGPALREGPAEPFLPRVQSWKRRPWGGGGGGRGRVQTGLWSVRAGSVWRAALGCLSPEPKNPLPRSGLGEYASAGTQQARVRKPPTGAPGWGSCDRAAGESSGWAWVEGPLQTTNTQPHTVSLPLCHGARGAGSRRPRRSSPDVPGSEALNRAPVGPPRVGPSHPPACPAPMGPGPGVRRARGGLPGRPGGQGPRGGPCPDGPRPGCPADPGRPPRPSRGVRGLRVGPCPDGPRPGGQGPRPGCPADPGRPPRPSRGSGAPGRALPRWAPARVSGEASRGGQGPRVGPCPDGPPPGCPGEASQAVPGVRGPGSGPAPMGPVPGVRGGFPGRPGGQGPRVGRAALPRRAPARVSGGPGESSPAVPGGQGPRPGCPGDASPSLPGVRGPGSGPAPMGPLPECPGRLPRPSRGSGAPGRALPRRAPASGAPGWALPRWAPSRVSGEASQAVPGVRGPGSGPAPMGPGPGVRGPGSGPAPMGPLPGVRGGFPGRPGGQGPRVGPSPPPACPAPMGPGSGGPSQPALPRRAPAGPTGTPPAPRAKAECVQMAALRARPSGLTENPGHLVALRADLLWRVQMAGLPRKSR
ncbi:hypothetical protein NDU88_008019 [Pleurodeles waltl]|uniref:Uncharacterized protein n=1 Tax=Pleurodeles waltl TaxID=8319 RepID=A0AAV7SU65_PLEWA|nr:hypothetical protein NDU88_008019 [Pleurodeles waltl]